MASASQNMPAVTDPGRLAQCASCGRLSDDGVRYCGQPIPVSYTQYTLALCGLCLKQVGCSFSPR
jgi:hypothetical protein